MIFAMVVIVKCETSLGSFAYHMSLKVKKFDPTLPPMSKKTIDFD